MKTSLFFNSLFFVFVISVFLLPACVSAQDQQEDKLAARLKLFLKRFPESDANKDGKLTREEAKEFNQKRRGQNQNGNRKSRADEKKFPEPTISDGAYGDHERKRFDLWAVPNAKSPTPLVIFIHGGGFRSGDKRAFNPKLIEFYHSKGIAFASMNYRLSRTGPYPIMMNDCARALQTIRHGASKWNVDATKIGTFGGSAGAGISLWLAFHDDLADPDSEDPIARQSTRTTAAGCSGGQSTYDVRTFRKWFEEPNLKLHDALFPFYGVEPDVDWNSAEVVKLMEDASPINHLSKDDNTAVYMAYNQGDVPVNAETDPNIWVHHYRLGLKLQEAMNELGKECHVHHRDQKKSEFKYQNMQAFMADKLLAK